MLGTSSAGKILLDVGEGGHGNAVISDSGQASFQDASTYGKALFGRLVDFSENFKYMEGRLAYASEQGVKTADGVFLKLNSHEQMVEYFMIKVDGTGDRMKTLSAENFNLAEYTEIVAKRYKKWTFDEFGWTERVQDTATEVAQDLGETIGDVGGSYAEGMLDSAMGDKLKMGLVIAGLVIVGAIIFISSDRGGKGVKNVGSGVDVYTKAQTGGMAGGVPK